MQNRMKEINILSVVRDDVVDKLFQILKDFLADEKIKADKMSGSLVDLLRLCELHSLQPILYYMFSSEIDYLREAYPEVVKRMRDQYIASVYLSVQQDVAAEEIAEHFGREGICLVFFKGVLWRRFYPEPQLRTMGDIDCLIFRDDRKRAHDLMVDIGYECESDKGDVWVYRRGNVSVEMHNRIAWNFSRNGFDYRNFFFRRNELYRKSGEPYFLE